MTVVGSRVEDFSSRALVGEAVKNLRLSDYAGRWVVLYFYTKDDTALCQSENVAFRDNAPEFEELGAQILAASVDSIESHKHWRDNGLGALPFPWLADESKVIAAQMGALHEDTGLALRATYIIDPDGILRFAYTTDLPTGRSTQEILRVLQALQSRKPTACNWQPGEPTL